MKSGDLALEKIAHAAMGRLLEDADADPSAVVSLADRRGGL